MHKKLKFTQVAELGNGSAKMNNQVFEIFICKVSSYLFSVLCYFSETTINFR